MSANICLALIMCVCGLFANRLVQRDDENTNIKNEKKNRAKWNSVSAAIVDIIWYHAKAKQTNWLINAILSEFGINCVRHIPLEPQ